MPGKTTLTMQGGPINSTEEERKTFEAMGNNIQQGFAGTFNQLADYLARSKWLNIILFNYRETIGENFITEPLAVSGKFHGGSQ